LILSKAIKTQFNVETVAPQQGESYILSNFTS